MSTSQHGGNAGPASANTPNPQRVYENPDRVTQLRINGFESSGAEASRVEISRSSLEIDRGEVEWERIYIPTLRLFSNGHLLFIQGMGPTQFFLASNLVLPTEEEVLGPLLYLRGQLPDVWVQPCLIKELVIAKLLRCPSNMLLQELNLLLFNKERTG